MLSTAWLALHSEHGAPENPAKQSKAVDLQMQAGFVPGIQGTPLNP